MIGPPQTAIWCATLLVGIFPPAVIRADTKLEQFFAQHCVQCHGPQEQNGEVRLDQPIGTLLTDDELLETIAALLEAGEMPPQEARQPPAEAVADALKSLEEYMFDQPSNNPLKRLTRTEYTFTMRDLFGVDFDLTGLLPPDHVEQGFDKFGEAHLMSPHQVMAYLKTARFIAERLLPEQRPATQQWEFHASHFHGSGRGEYRDGDGFLLSAFRPWRSNVHFSTKPDAYERFKIPAFGKYRFETRVESVGSEEAEIIGVNLGDGRYPTNFRGIRRIPLPQGAKGFTTELTLNAGDEVSFTFDSGRVQSTNAKPKEYQGAKLRFTEVKITGPIVEEWPTAAMRTLLPRPDIGLQELVDHLALLLTERPLSAEDRSAFMAVGQKQLDRGSSPTATARSILIALLTSPHFIYKAESQELTDVERAHRLSYFLWNSVPDSKLLDAARSSDLVNDPSAQVERMLNDDRVDRFVEDFTRQWLQLDKVDDFGPDVRVFKNVRRMTVDSMSREGRELFHYMLQNNLSMEHFIDSDFVMVNDRLARFYGLPEVEGDAFEPVELPEESERGGLVAQAGFLKLTSTDFATSPIHRGAWILKNLYNEQIEPPADVLINEPDIRGTTTIREAILKHQQLASCTRCHSKIDPLGFALEYYDPVGRKRREYRHVEELPAELEGTTFKRKLKFTKVAIEAAMELPDGREVRDLPTLKAALMADQELIFKGIIGKLISYALGRETTRSDRPYIDSVYDSIAEEDFSLRAAIHAIVANPAFGRK